MQPNAKLTPRARLLLVERVCNQDWPVARAARAAGVSRQTAHEWLNRFKEEGRPRVAGWRRASPSTISELS